MGKKLKVVKKKIKKCKACIGTGVSSKGEDCRPCAGTGSPAINSNEEPRGRLICDDCLKIREPMYMTKDGLLCLSCIQIRRKVIDVPVTNSDKRKEKLSGVSPIGSLEAYKTLEKKQKLAFISECSNSKLLREIIEHEKEHSKKRYKRAIRSLTLLTK